MAIDATTAGMMFSSGFEAWQQYEAGQASEAMYEAQRAEIANQTAYAQRMALEEQKTIAREGRSAASAARAAAGKSGLAVGGSVVTLTQAIGRQVERRKALIALEYGETARRGQFEQRRLKYMGKSAKYAGTVAAAESLLVGTHKLYKRKEKQGWTWDQLFFTDRREK